MKPFLIAFLLFTGAAYADNSRYVSLVSTNGYYPSIQILTGETAEIVTCHDWSGTAPVQSKATVTKDGLETYGYAPGYGPILHGTTVAGPATIKNDIPGSLLTVKITPESYDPNKTLIVPPGTNQVMITLESSTNLVSWSTATNGIYGSPDTARFFRIKMDKLGPP